MTHRQVLKNLLLFIDGEMPKEDMEKISRHLSSCTRCSDRLNRLQEAWKSEGVPGNLKPSPFLWTRLEARIVEHERKRRSFWGTGLLPVSFRVVTLIVAIIMGILLGTPEKNQPSPGSEIRTESLAFSHEFELGLFDMIPPDSPGRAITNTIGIQR